MTCCVDGCDRPVGDAWVCMRCSRHGRANLVQVPWIHKQLDRAITRQTAYGEQLRDYITGSSGHPLPLDWNASIIAGTLQNTLQTWARVVCEERYDNNIRPIDPSVSGCAKWLGKHIEWFRHHPAGNEFFEEVHAIVTEAWEAIDAPANRASIAVGPCPEVDDDGRKCTGEVRAIIPASDHRAAFMICAMCGMRWESWQWRRAGRRILRMLEA